MKTLIFNEDCVEGAKKHLKDGTIDLLVCDPPFGINESTFDKHYNREGNNIVDGYVEAPPDYYVFTEQWLLEAKRVLKDSGSMYIISGWSNLKDILNAIDNVGLYLINHMVWQFNFGVYTKNKYVTSHYHMLYISKDKSVKTTFNRFCRFGPSEKNVEGLSLNYKDVQDVWFIKKEFHQNEKKNKNKLPNELLKKIILYSSNEGDTVCDFFLGNFTTANVAKELARTPCGFELNKNSFDINKDRLKKIVSGSGLTNLREPIIEVPANQGKKISKEERESMINDFKLLINKNVSKKDAMAKISNKYGRGKFSIINIVKGIEKENNDDVRPLFN